jgi:hypothetical protein
MSLEFSVGATSRPEILEIEGRSTQGSRPGRTVGELLGVIFGMDNYEWLNWIRYHILDTTPDTEIESRSKGYECD